MDEPVEPPLPAIDPPVPTVVVAPPLPGAPPLPITPPEPVWPPVPIVPPELSAPPLPGEPPLPLGELLGLLHASAPHKNRATAETQIERFFIAHS